VTSTERWRTVSGVDSAVRPRNFVHRATKTVATVGRDGVTA
jgi:hypothetical protein